MQDAIFAFMLQFGYLAVSALIFLENVFPPIPSELILPLAGFFSNAGALWLPFAILAATAGSLAGAYVLYAIGTVLDEKRMERLLSSIEGAGRVSVMISQGTDGEIAGVVVAASGADDLRVMLELQRAVRTLTGLELDRIEIVKSKG